MVISGPISSTQLVLPNLEASTKFVHLKEIENNSEPDDPECSYKEVVLSSLSSEAFLSLGGSVTAHLVIKNNEEAKRQQL